MNYKKFLATLKKASVCRKKLNLLAALLLATSSAFAQVPSYVPTNGLVGWWPFNGNANDESGNGNNGMVNGATLITDRHGNINSAYTFNGVNNFISVSGASAVTYSSGITISCWYKSTIAGPSSAQFLVAKGSDNIQGHIHLAYHSSVGKFQGDINGIGNDIYTPGIYPYPFSDWKHVVFTYDNHNLLIYINNVLMGTYAHLASIGSLNSAIYFGTSGMGSAFSYFTIGDLDDIGIWNRALNQQEITALYNAQSCIGNITADGITTFCAGNYVNLTSDVVGGTYQWKKNGVNITTNATSKTYKATATGSYTCVATCNGTALTSNAIAVTSKTNASASVSASGATSFCAGDSVTLNATNLGSNYSVQWYRTNISMENATAYSQVVKQPGTYKVVTKNLSTGCSRISGSAITTSVNCRIAGDVTSGSIIQENTNVDSRFIDNELSQGVHVFPNPNSGVFSFNYDGEETGDAVLQIINNIGQSIYQSRLSVPEGGFTQDLQLGDNITKGIYIVRLLINNSYHDSKVIVK